MFRIDTARPEQKKISDLQDEDGIRVELSVSAGSCKLGRLYIKHLDILLSLKINGNTERSPIGAYTAEGQE
jgi:hypothetical protein